MIFRVVGVKVSVKSGGALMLSSTVTVLVREPLVPVIVRVWLPAGDEANVLMPRVVDCVALGPKGNEPGVNVFDTPAGIPLIVKVIVPLKVVLAEAWIW